jgi:UDP-3-O-[3-hydroxymyristoyl] glucosamine N-acyltransferase
MLTNSNNKPVCILGKGTVANSLATMIKQDGYDCCTREVESAITADDFYNYQYLIGVSKASTVRKKAISWLEENMLHSPVLIHNMSFVANPESISNGTIVFPHANVLSSEIGAHCILAPFTHVGHNAKIQNSCLFLPYASTLGSSFISSFAVLQTRSTILDMVHINSEYVNILPASVVTKDINKSGTYGGSPARYANSATTITSDYFKSS